MTYTLKRVTIFALAIAAVLSVTAQTPVRPLVKGSVFGGGRMADVNGKTNVEVKECQAIGAVFGGNDIAGKVNGADGATVTIGTGSKTTDIIVGSVYGGGNGYYYYPGGVGTTVFEVVSGDTVAKTLPAGDVTGYAASDRSTVYATLAAASDVPSVQKTLVSVVSDRVYIDSLFGGAKNAIVSGDATPAASDTTASIRISAGTVFSVFGGNNYGGFLAKNTTQHIVVSGSKALEPDNSSLNLGGDYATGMAHTGASIAEWTPATDAHAIRYLFGGGNRVPGQNVHIEVNGGQIDTCFGGGNSADVRTVLVDVNVTTPLYTLATSPYTNATTYAYDAVTSLFDIRCLFGGNNAADMTGLPTLNLTKGGIHNVYGGGNKGVMLAAGAYTDNYNLEGITPSNTDNHNAGAKRSTNVVVNSADFIADTIYGGGQSAGTIHDTYVEIAAGNVGVVYGGTNIMGRIGPEEHTGLVAPRDLAKTNVYIHGGTVHNTVFGASNGYYRCHDGMTYSAGTNILFADGDAYANLSGKYTPSVFNSYVYITGGVIKGNVYSSGNMAAVGKPAALDGGSQDSAGIALLHITGGTIGVAAASDTVWGNVFGGGNMGCVYGASDLVISGSPIIYGNVYGGNDKTGRVFATLRGSGISDLHNNSSAATAEVSSSEYPGVHTSDLAIGSTIPLTQNNASTYTLITGTPKIYGSVFGGGNGDYIYVNTYNAKQDLVSGGTAAEKVVIDCSQTPSADQRSSFVDINLAATGYAARVFGGGNSKTTGYSQREGSSGTVTEFGDSYVFLNCTAAPADNDDDINVGTIFGGNNNVEMNSVPRIAMLQGKVGNVYGGGNLGAMTGSRVIASLPLSTYVATPSDNVVVTRNIYGGCNVADVTNDTYVKITQGIVRGNIFGGNDLSGEVGVSHVIIEGADGKDLLIRGNVYGGGNGDYPFYVQERDANGAYYTKSDGTKVYAYNDAAAADGAADGVDGKYCYSHFAYFDLDGRPYVDSAAVVLNGEFTINGNVYGGGISGDCRKTNVLVDAEEGVFNGMIFGAGRGRVDNMGLRINGICKAYYIGVAQDADNDGVTDRDGSGNIIYGEGNAMGNVLDTAWLTVRQFKSMSGSRSAMFGGGQSGNVGTTVVTYEPTATSRLDALYLGCLASDVKNASTGVIDAYEPTDGKWIIDTVYGGNDFTGRVENTDLVINSGIFTHVFGAGNGEYNYKNLLATWTAEGGRLNDDLSAFSLSAICADTVPYTMDVNVTINGGNYLGTVYGGGNMGLVGDRDMVAANMDADDDDRGDYMGTITLNVHGGEFRRHIFTGARGKTEMTGTFFGLGTTTGVDGQRLGKQLAYAQKILNMDGGHVAFSVYGGSEAVDDGFPYECIGAANNAANPNQNTTLRPSSIVNITGGRIEKSVYGGGYQGNIYGSVYVNVGIDAVRDSKVWTAAYGPAGHTFTLADYKPNLTDHSGYDISTVYDGSAVTQTYVPKAFTTVEGLPTLKKGIINLEASIYNASDWGEAGSNAYFNTRGVYGGETNILVDGKGYYTSLTNHLTVDQPSMDIAQSIIGAGTSTEGGDVNRLITLRHYGDYFCPDPSKTLYSIQRADKVVLDSVFINMLGEQDAYSAYASPSYAFCRIDTLLFRIDNIVTIEAPAIHIGNISSMKTDEVYAINDPNQIYNTDEVPQSDGSNVPNDFYDNLPGGECSTECQDLDICTKLPNLRGGDESVAAYNVLMMRNGSYVKVYPFIDNRNNTTLVNTPDGIDDGNHNFGHIYGWMYLLAQDKTMSYVYADFKDNATNSTDGGFVAPCSCDNQSGEIQYTNVDGGAAGYTAEDYRTWKVGTTQGTRVRHITLVANANPDGILNYNLTPGSYDLYKGTADSPDSSVTIPEHYAYATTYLELPPADAGNFYFINSVLIDQDNGGQLSLVDQGYINGENVFMQSAPVITADASFIAGNPDFTFGLTFASGNNFDSTDCWNTDSFPLTYVETPSGDTRNLVNTDNVPPTRYNCWKRSNISGNQYVTSQGGYLSNAIVNGAVAAIPTMDFTLTYNTDLHSTITRDVVYTIQEFTPTGEYVGPIEVTVTISTVINEFADLEAPVLAMYNEGISNEYVRKVTIPASFHQRDIYIEGIEWMKDTSSAGGSTSVYDDPLKENWFNMIEYPGDTVGSNQLFSIIVRATENTSENISNTLSWYDIVDTNGVDVYRIAKDGYEATTGGVFRDAANGNKTDSIYCSWNYDGAGHAATIGGPDAKGVRLGTLDGRAAASVDIVLNYNSMYYYHQQFDPPLAWIRLKCHYYNTKSEGDSVFYINVKLRTRLQGDTIYMAPQPTLTRNAVSPDGTTQQLIMHAYGYGYNEESGTYADGSTTPPTIPNFVNINNDKKDIKNNPNNYLQDFRTVMTIYEEGDVIDIMETIPITDGAAPITVMGDDYSTIQIIRYSGSHYKFPTLGCANYNPLIEVAGNGLLTMRNIWFNGSGCTRVKEGITTTDPDGNKFVDVGTYRYYENHKRVNELLYANAPILYCHGNGNVTFSKRVIMMNNFNANFDRAIVGNAPNADFIGGGAIAMVNDAVTGSPMVMMGDLCNVYDNLVVDWNAVTPGGTSDWLPRNYGGGVYVNGGQFVVGGGAKGSELHIARNFYLKDTSDNAGVQQKTAYVFMDESSSDEMVEKTFEVYYLDTLMHSSDFSLSNVYLTRKAASPSTECQNLVRLDEQSDVVYFLNEMSPNSRIGISKWFPGYVYENSRTDVHTLTNPDPRDTITIARIGKGKSNTSMVDNIYNAQNFFNDSSYTSITDRTGTADSPVPPATEASFSNLYPRVAYDENATDYNNYNDRVFVYRHTSLGQYNIYFQRCASFRKGVTQKAMVSACYPSDQQFNDYEFGDSISYQWNKDASCALSMDTLQFRVGGGFFPYTYKWENISGTDPVLLHTRVTTGSNAISRFDVDEYKVLRTKAQFDTLVLRLEVGSGVLDQNVMYRATAIDLTGNCELTQDVKVRIVKVDDGNYYTDATDFLQHGTGYQVPAPGVDSSNFHDHEGFVPTGVTRLEAADKTPSYLRTFRSYKVKPTIYPVAARGTIGVYNETGDDNLYTMTASQMGDAAYLPDVDFCPGEIIRFSPAAASSTPSWEYVGWSYDQSASAEASFVVSASDEENKPVVYYAPGDYWWQHVTSKPDGYQVDYYGNVTITSKEGLAWLISTVNGYNGQNAQTFHFNTITLDGDFNMQEHKWTPLGNANNKFEGTFIGNGHRVKNVIVNETTIPLVGMFGYTDGANISGFIIDSTLVRGNSLVGSLVAEATEMTIMKNIGISHAAIFGQYSVGGFVSSMSSNSVLDSPVIIGNIDMYGSAVYASGYAAQVDRSSIINSGNQNQSPNDDNGDNNNGNNGNKNTKDGVDNSTIAGGGVVDFSHLAAIYVGGIVGYCKADGSSQSKSAIPSIINNNYVHIITSDNSQRVGGLVGYAEDLDMNNNYVYGVAKYNEAEGMMGGIAGIVGDNVTISNCYVVDGMSQNLVGYNSYDTPMTKSTSFSGNGNRVTLAQTVDGYNNMTRALNAWVRDNGDTIYNTWRSDLTGVNNGYPIFGEPDLIPVFDTIETASCENFEFDGLTFDQSGVYVFHFVDSADFVDSTLTLMLTINYGDTTRVSDTVDFGNGYEGNGFSLTAEELRTALSGVGNSDIYTLQLVDSLQNANGCDSLVVLTLYVMGVQGTPEVQKLVDVKVYPNPTLGVVYVEGSDLQSIEVYDNVSHRVLSRTVEGDKASFDLGNQAAGSYYVRIRTANGTVVKKVIKK